MLLIGPGWLGAASMLDGKGAWMEVVSFERKSNRRNWYGYDRGRTR